MTYPILWFLFLEIHIFCIVHYCDLRALQDQHGQDPIQSFQSVNLHESSLGKLQRPHYDLTIDDGECKGNHPQMAELFRSVNV